jgi:hypothetical protein
MADEHLNTPEEIWKAIPGFEGYEVSNHGRVRSYYKKTAPTGQGYKPGWVIDTEPQRILRNAKTKDGYPYVGLNIPGKRRFIRVHQLVLIAFIGPCPPGMEACHNDGDTSNCFLENLRWDTVANNTLDKYKHGSFLLGENAPRAKLNNEQVIKIREMASQGYGYRQLGRMFSVGHHNICCIVHKKTWKHI